MAIQSGPLQRPLAVMMCRTLRTISPDATLLEAAQLMRNAKVGALLVHEAGHDYRRRRAFVDSVPDSLLALRAPQAAAEIETWRASMPAPAASG